jgi:hypothetical protein
MAIKLGPPKKGEVREELVKITFKADSATVDDLAFIELHIKDVSQRGRRSVAIRRALRELREKLEADAS